ncbi:MAG: PrsW family intramembrane metalloprotease [Haloferacaceae archaeon]
MSPRVDPRAIARIARWEVARSAAALDRRTAAVVVAALLLAGGVTAAGVAAGGPALDRDIYRVGVAPENPYHDPVAASTALDARPPDRAAFRRGDLELVVVGRQLRAHDTPKGRAALARFRDDVRAYNTRLMANESNRSAAYPVVVTLRYADRGSLADGSGDGAAGGGPAGDGGGGRGGSSNGSGEDGGRADGSGGLAVPDVGGAAGPLGGRAGGTGGSPAEISPPFPFGSLILAFAFLVPMNFVVQSYGSAMLDERINRRGELLLVAPISPTDIVAGKTLPYFGAMVALVAAVAVGVGGGPVSVAAVLPVALAFLGATFVGAMFARSFKELTFVTVSVSVFLTAYTFVPAIFTDVTPVALISPLTVVVRDLQGTGVTAGEFLFATGPLSLVGLGLFALGTGVYREEDLFTQRPVPLKLLDALAARLHRPRSVAVVSAFSIPFVAIAELLVLALLFAVPQSVAVPVLLVAIAAVEEVAKSLHLYAGMFEGPFDRTGRTALRLGALSGLGFFLGEKLLVVAQLVGLSSVPLGRTAVATAGVLPVGALLVAPLALHVVTATVSAVAATRGLRSYVAGLVAATALHAAYNLAVVTAVG